MIINKKGRLFKAGYITHGEGGMIMKRVGLNERQIETVAYVKKNGRITNKEFANKLDILERIGRHG